MGLHLKNSKRTTAQASDHQCIDQGRHPVTCQQAHALRVTPFRGRHCLEITRQWPNEATRKTKAVSEDLVCSHQIHPVLV